ncbi:sensor histidine kinase [Cohaesibacter celericrescens]|uniref:histidine kinase n=1 Tax=Cohaesibacter celericrescens TaxID=2067669 RepID=A0A2N5XND6_9HYPH|nr:sensor histidine kinase [Cohaesibacter celericrescens]PLW75995.1 sensor histidine kinase [Cohaesibacter celericrescens]
MSDHPSPYSLRRRLLLWLMIPLGLVAVLAMMDSYFNARETATEAADRVLTGSVLAISERVYVNDDGKLEVDIPYVALDMLTSAAQDRVFYRIDGPDNIFVTGYHQLPVPEFEQKAEQRGTVRFADITYKQDSVRIAVMQSAASSGLHSIPYRVSVAETTVARQKLTQEILIRSALRQLLLVLSAAIIVWFAVTRGLRPLHKLEAAIGRRSLDDLRPILHHVPQEVGGLVQRFNDFMVHLSGAIQALKNFTGNASHQIRTPLAIIRTQITLASRAETLEEAKASLQTCNNAITDAERTLSQLMLLARVDARSSQTLTNAQINLSHVAREVTMGLVPQAASMGFDLGFEGEDDLHCKGEAILVGELLKNLLDNAIKHATGGDEITVRVTAATKDGTKWTRLEVQDNGVGMPKDALALIERFKRPEQSINGSGLGLAIAQEITTLFGGQMCIQTPPTKTGTLVQIDFRRSF